VWSDSAKNLTIQAAEKARFRRMKSIRLISEPEAAAVCCLKEIEPNNLKVIPGSRYDRLFLGPISKFIRLGILSLSRIAAAGPW